MTAPSPAVPGESEPTGPLRRRCHWCGITLRWWRLNLCRPCKRALVLDRPSPPFPERSRWDADPRCEVSP